MGASNVKH